jgi:hypothetical protein
MLFDSQDLLTSHLREEMEAERCDVKPKRALDGITPETELLLKRRKKDYKGQSEPELWKKMYRILFPDEIVPSPCKFTSITPSHIDLVLHSHYDHNPDRRLKQETDFEAFLDESADQLDLQDRTDYDAFCRRELPRLVRSHLVSAAASQLQALEFALQTQLDEIIEKCLEQLSASYEALRTIDTAPNEAENALPAIIPTGSVDPPTPMEVQHGREYSDEADNIREIQYTSDYFTKVSQYPNQSPAPAGSAMHDLYGQPDDLLTRVLSFKDTENLALYLNAARGCLCPVDACSCPRPRELRQEEGHCLPPAAFQFKARAKILERAPVLEDWNPDEFLVGPGSETDEINLN